MGDVVDFGERIAAAFGEDRNEEFDAFLLAEGLDLMAAFRSIGDPAVRMSIVKMVRAVAMSSADKDA